MTASKPGTIRQPGATLFSVLARCGLPERAGGFHRRRFPDTPPAAVAIEPASSGATLVALYTNSCVFLGEEVLLIDSPSQASGLAPDLADRGLPSFGGPHNPMLRSVSMIASARRHSPWFCMCIRLASSAASIAMSPSRFVDSEDVTVAPGRSRLRPGFCVYMFYSAVQEAYPSKYYCSGKAGARTDYVQFGWIIIDLGMYFLCYCYLHSGSGHYLEFENAPYNWVIPAGRRDSQFALDGH